MRARKPLKKEYDKFLQDIVDSKNGARGVLLKGQVATVKSRYLEYKKAYKSDTLEQLSTATYAKDVHAALRHCYDVETKALGVLQQKIFDNQPYAIRKTCPYCCISPTQETDHYVPSEEFPEFAVLALNLIPACGACNKKKGKRWRNKTTSRMFLNFYLDVIPDEPFLDVSMSWKKVKRALVPTATFSLKPCPVGVGKRLWALIESHFKELDLLQQYQDATAGEYVTFRAAALTVKAPNEHELSVRLQDFTKETAAKFGQNNWRVVLDRALASDPKFLADVVKNTV